MTDKDASRQRPTQSDPRKEAPRNGASHRKDDATDEHEVVRFATPRVREIRRAGQNY
jgi:hypothetical protein